MTGADINDSVSLNNAGCRCQNPTSGLYVVVTEMGGYEFEAKLSCESRVTQYVLIIQQLLRIGDKNCFLVVRRAA